MDLSDLLQTALRATLVYYFLLLVVRILGKRSIGAISAFDLVVALMLGEMVDSIIFGDVPLAKGLLALCVVAVWHFVTEWGSARSQRIDRLTAGEPALVIDKGRIQHKVLAHERLNEAELLAQMRLQGIDNVAEVEAGRVETNGHISFIHTEAARPAQKGDLQHKSA